jgi:hypothetical protein
MADRTVFLVLYLLFFSATGLNQLVDGTLQGKLIRANRRGRLLGIAGADWFRGCRVRCAVSAAAMDSAAESRWFRLHLSVQRVRLFHCRPDGEFVLRATR